MLENILPYILTLLVSGVLYYYFKRKISVVENKLNLMFELIQEHGKTEQLRNSHFSPSMGPMYCTMGGETNDNADALDEDNTNDLISVSGNDEDSNDSDENESESESDYSDDSNDGINIEDAELDRSKIITLGIEGAEKNNSTEIKEINTKMIGSSISLDPVSPQPVEVENTDNSNDPEEDTTLVNNLSDYGDITVQKLKKDDEIDDIDLSDEIDVIKEPVEFSKLSVNELKQECEKRNLTGFKSLRKGGLIELLEGSKTLEDS